MARSRPLVYALLLLVGLVAFADRPAKGDGPPGAAAPAGVRVKVEKDDGTKFDGVLAGPALAMDSDYGRLELALKRVKVIDFADVDGKTLALVETTDGAHLRGTPQFDMLTVRVTDADVRELPLREVRELTVLREADHSLLGLALGLLALTALEIVLGIDNVIFLAIVAGRLPPEQQPKARRIGLAAALGTRILLLFSLSWLLGLTRPVVTLPVPALAPDAAEVSWRDIILLAGGAFLIFKSVMEMHHKFEEARRHQDAAAGVKTAARAVPSFAKVIAQIAVIDIVFSLDSVITAVGVVDNVYVMIAAMVVAMIVMLVSAGPISRFVEKHPTVKVLALSFLILIGVLLVAEGFGQHINKGYIYFAMAFAVVLEFINMRLRPKGVTGLIVDRSEAPGMNG